MEKTIAIPCPHMVYDQDNYIQCKLQPVDDDVKKISDTKFCLCAWFYDMSNPGFTIEISFNPSGKIGSISTFDFPDSVEYKEMIERTMTEADVPKLCPRGFTYKQIDAKIQSLFKRREKVVSE